MSKSTKVIAALGVAAGLGVAALPAATFAIDPTYTGTNNSTALTTNTNTVPLKVTVNDVLSLSVATTGDFAGTPAADAEADPPVAAGTDGSVSGAGASINPGASDAGSQSVLTAKSNGNLGWTITVAGTNSGAGATLTGPSNGTDNHKIAPFSSEVTDITEVGASGWGIKLSNASSDLTVSDANSDFTESGYKGISTAVGGSRVIVSSTPTGQGDSTDSSNITAGYGVRASKQQAAGTYTGSIIYTIANNE